MNCRFSPLLLASLALLQACTTAPNQSLDLNEIQADIETRTGAAIARDQKDPSAQRALATLRAEPLTEDNAVRLALLQSPALQAEYQRLAVSYADVVQAGRLSNPQLHVTPGFSLDGGATRIAAGLAFNFLELLTRRTTIEAASFEFETTKAQIVGTVVAHASAVRRAHADYIAARERVALAETKQALAKTRREVAWQLYTADEVDLQRVSLEEQAYLNTRADVETTKADLISTGETLRLRVGLQNLDRMNIPQADAVQDLYLPNFDAASMVTLEWRPDLITARANIGHLEALKRQQRRGLVIGSAEAGVELEREDSENFVGPSVSVQLPVFDQGQVQIARADALLKQANYNLEQSELQALTELKTAFGNVEAARSVTSLREGQQMSAANANLRLTEQFFNAGEADIFAVFDARTNLLDLKSSVINARLELRHARYAVNEAMGGIPATRF